MLAATFLLLLSACEQKPYEITTAGPIMGTSYRVTVVVSPSDTRQQRIEKQTITDTAIAAMESVNQSMSTYIPSSELSQINRLAANRSVMLSTQLYEVLNEALTVSRQSDGFFDVTMGKAIRLWGFAEDGTIEKKPSDEVLAELRNQVGYDNIVLNGQELTKLSDGLEINVSAIAKGYAVDKVAQALEQLGIKNYLVDIGGELKAKGVNEAGLVWQVGIEKPHITGGLAQIVALKDKAIATSGDYRNYIDIDGERFSHTIDPTTLRPVFHRLASVSVISDNASTADAMATAIFAMGEQRGVDFAQRNGLVAYFIIRDNAENSYQISTTNGFETYLAN